MSRTTRYSAAVLDHFRRPRNVGVVDGADAEGWATNTGCGDTVRLTLRIGRNVIQEARFKALGCVAAIAAASRLTELLTGRTLEEAAALSNASVAAALGGLPAHKVACSVLAEEAVDAALKDYKERARSGTST